jgi:hypothetical protein
VTSFDAPKHFRALDGEVRVGKESDRFVDGLVRAGKESDRFVVPETRRRTPLLETLEIKMGDDLLLDLLFGVHASVSS